MASPLTADAFSRRCLTVILCVGPIGRDVGRPLDRTAAQEGKNVRRLLSVKMDIDKPSSPTTLPTTRFPSESNEDAHVAAEYLPKNWKLSMQRQAEWGGRLRGGRKVRRRGRAFPGSWEWHPAPRTVGPPTPPSLSVPVFINK